MVDNLIQHRFTKKKPKTFENKKIKEIKTNAQLKFTCQSESMCAIAFLNTKPGDENLSNFHNLVDRLEALSKRPSLNEISYGWINTSCAESLLKKFDFDENKGGIITYQNWRDEYTKLPLPIDDYLLINFFEKSYEKSFPTNAIDKSEFIINEDKCLNKEVTKKKKKVSDDTKIEKSDEAEIIKTDL